MHGKGLAFEESAGGFAAQIIALYTQTLGEWSRPLIGISALAVVYSTVMAATDGYSRIAATIVSCFKAPEIPAQNLTTNTSNTLYICCVVIFSAGSLCIIMFLMGSFKTLIDIATTLSFLTTPVLAFLIHRCIMSNDIPQEVKPGRFLWFLQCALHGHSNGICCRLYFPDNNAVKGPGSGAVCGSVRKFE